MTIQPAVVRLQSLLGSFGRSERGNIAILFAIAVVPVISFVGAAVDYTRANTARSSMQSAMDSTSLMLAKDLQDGTINTSQITQKAEDYFKALYSNPDAKSVGVTATYTAAAGNGSKILINGNGKIDTSFMRLVGIQDINFNVSATSAWGNVRMRVAMALDVTGSMKDDGKMPAMQTAAKSLIDQLSPLAKNPGDIYISVVPFAKDVNLGSSYYNETWIDWSVWEAANNTMGTCSNTNYTTKNNCQEQQQDLDARPQQMDRLRHRPHAGLRHQEHGADFVQCADDGRCRGIRLRLTKNTARRATTPICRRSCR